MRHAVIDRANAMATAARVIRSPEKNAIVRTTPKVIQTVSPVAQLNIDH